MNDFNYQQMLDEQREEKENAFQFAVDFEVECLEPTKMIDKVRTALKDHVGIKIESHVVDNFLNTVGAEILIDDFCQSLIRDLAIYKRENDIEDAA